MTLPVWLVRLSGGPGWLQLRRVAARGEGALGRVRSALARPGAETVDPRLVLLAVARADGDPTGLGRAGYSGPMGVVSSSAARLTGRLRGPHFTGRGPIPCLSCAGQRRFFTANKRRTTQGHFIARLATSAVYRCSTVLAGRWRGRWRGDISGRRRGSSTCRSSGSARSDTCDPTWTFASPAFYAFLSPGRRTRGQSSAVKNLDGSQVSPAPPSPSRKVLPDRIRILRHRWFGKCLDLMYYLVYDLRCWHSSMAPDGSTEEVVLCPARVYHPRLKRFAAVSSATSLMRTSVRLVCVGAPVAVGRWPSLVVQRCDCFERSAVKVARRNPSVGPRPSGRGATLAVRDETRGHCPMASVGEQRSRCDCETPQFDQRENRRSSSSMSALEGGLVVDRTSTSTPKGVGSGFPAAPAGEVINRCFLATRPSSPSSQIFPQAANAASRHAAPRPAPPSP